MSNHTEDKSDFAKKAEMLSHASVEEFQTPTWNAAIQSCIEICDEARDLEAVTHNEELFLDAIVQRLQSLKK